MLLRLNVWFYYNDLRKSDRFHGFPYTALAVSTLKDIEFSSIEDIHKELLILCDKTIENGGTEIGKEIWKTLPHFVNDEILISQYYYNQITKVGYLKSTHTPPYPSMIETPANFVDEYMIIDSEINSVTNYSQKEHKKKKKNG